MVLSFSKMYFKQFSEYLISIGVIDDCIIIRFPEIERIEYYNPGLVESFQDIIEYLSYENFNKSILDISNIKNIYTDLTAFIDELPGETVISIKSDMESVLPNNLLDYPIIKNTRLKPPTLTIPIELPLVLDNYTQPSFDTFFIDDFPKWKSFREKSIPKDILPLFEKVDKKRQYYIEILPDDEILFDERRTSDGLIEKYLDKLGLDFDISVRKEFSNWLAIQLNNIACESPLHQLAFSVVDDRINVGLYHCGALYPLKSDTGETFISRPAIIANRTCLVFRSALEELEYLINQPKLKEEDLQDFFKRNPNFLLGSEYQRLYPQVILQRDKDNPLKPDFIIQPAKADPWCDILDLKLPSVPLIVGSKNRLRLSAGVSDGVAQLREYGAYFDSKINRDKIYKQLNIRCYKPKLILVVGRDTSRLSENQVRRELTRYNDLSLITYDSLIEIAKRRLLL